MKQKTALVLILVTFAVAGWLAWSSLRAGKEDLRAQVAVAAPLSASAAGFARADGPRPLNFPADVGPHEDYQTEWWYYTGNLAAPTGEHFGYQLTFFRRALQPPAERVARPSTWAAEQVYLAHLALTDVAGGAHYNFSQMARGAAGLAGAQAQPYRVWLDSWSVTEGPDGTVHLQAANDTISLKLDLRDLKGWVLQGDRGYSRKGPEPGNASYYISQTRIATSGEVALQGRGYRVQGLSWMDHEFSTSALTEGQVGWDWYSLQLDDNRELMLFQIRQSDGSVDPFSSGTVVEPDGTTRPLARDDFQVRPTGRWRSPHTGAIYPSGWQVRVPSRGLELTLTPYLPDQEMNVGYSYWEGAVRVQGTDGGRPLAGSGYVELTGYAGSMAGQF